MAHTEQKPLIGAHMSISDGFDGAVQAGESIGCTAIQIFTHSNRQWHAAPLKDEAIEAFKGALKNSDIRRVIAHASYLLNVGSPKKAVRDKSIKALVMELDRCQALGIPHLVLHPGSALDGSPEECIDSIASALDEACEAMPGSTMILLENMAGQGSSIGATLEQLATIRAKTTHKKRIGFCIDTCHAFAAGYNLTTEAGYKKFWKEFDQIIGMEHLKAMHLNDSKKELGSKVDRHEHIGHGQLGKITFKLIMNDPALLDIPKILETPKDATLADDVRNLATLRELIVKH